MPLFYFKSAKHSRRPVRREHLLPRIGTKLSGYNAFCPRRSAEYHNAPDNGRRKAGLSHNL